MTIPPPHTAARTAHRCTLARPASTARPAPPTPDLHTIGEVAALAGVTVRTLHHYDRIGLLVPSRRAANGYRQYNYGDLDRLRQIRLLCELRFRLEAIGEMLDAPAYGRRSNLVAQRELLRERQERTERIIHGVDRALAALDEERQMKTTEMFEGLAEFDHSRTSRRHRSAGATPTPTGSRCAAPAATARATGPGSRRMVRPSWRSSQN